MRVSEDIGGLAGRLRPALSRLIRSGGRNREMPELTAEDRRILRAIPADDWPGIVEELSSFGDVVKFRIAWALNKPAIIEAVQAALEDQHATADTNGQ